MADKNSFMGRELDYEAHLIFDNNVFQIPFIRIQAQFRLALDFYEYLDDDVFIEQYLGFLF